ncbi:plasmid pRiA4b ORF-3 family protein [Buttiauxella warmboldiae]|uniref:Plasmid pRiA4b ORF-3 family protein n=1 Tax=Buttiauxella warmboldiae TaxID=82993 RepID=A0A3N5DYZ1_9ENTR|nr:plasmid pRiA4b ORF-3 family protein [Buttiauxella warmboldiae]RPH27669.1 plasmid pRiA4b ORF-3 family protein [Buttiauxella warmboldiae]
MNSFYQLKIVLQDSNPAIWRRFVVPGFITLDRLHDVIQIVMGWEESHLHEFIFKKQHYTMQPESPHEQEEGMVRLGELLKRKGNSLTYVYDFGDNWSHEIILEDKNYPEDEIIMPYFCLEGECACPPEDCGGVYGYARVLEAVQDPHHEQHEDMMDIISNGSDLSPDEVIEYTKDFNCDEVNSFLALYSVWSRDRLLTMFE